MTVTIYHNPKCGTSRNTLGLPHAQARACNEVGKCCTVGYVTQIFNNGRLNASIADEA